MRIAIICKMTPRGAKTKIEKFYLSIFFGVVEFSRKDRGGGGGRETSVPELGLLVF